MKRPPKGNCFDHLEIPPTTTVGKCMKISQENLYHVDISTATVPCLFSGHVFPSALRAAFRDAVSVLKSVSATLVGHLLTVL